MFRSVIEAMVYYLPVLLTPLRHEAIRALLSPLLNPNSH
jgi:hypothetical protein